LVRVPIGVEGEDPRSQATFRYSIGPFVGKETALALQDALSTLLRFRIPLELFHNRERFLVEVLAASPTGTKKILWAKRWEVKWEGKAPALEPMTE
jgi:hypothetical protein